MAVPFNLRWQVGNSGMEPHEMTLLSTTRALRRCVRAPLALAGFLALSGCGPRAETASAHGEKVLRIVPQADLEHG